MTAAEQVRLFSRWLEGTGIELFELDTGDAVIRLRRDPAGRFAPADAAPELATIRAPSVGVFRRAHPSRAAPLAQVGQRVEAGDPVALLQVGTLLVHVAAPQAGTVLEVLAEDGAPVGYGTALIHVAGDGVP